MEEQEIKFLTNEQGILLKIFDNALDVFFESGSYKNPQNVLINHEDFALAFRISTLLINNNLSVTNIKGEFGFMGLRVFRSSDIEKHKMIIF